MDYRKNLLNDQIVDVSYQDFISSPLHQIKSIYMQLGFDMNIETGK
jgi:hypothetical protein